ncbi:MAG: pyridoxal-phosphate-dependent aminotransferase family protein [Candidatus Hydrothermarchaeales archaeon]
MKRTKLMIPGPVELSPGVLEEMAKPLIGHRTPEFDRILVYCWDTLKKIFQTKNDVVLITASGTAAMDAAIANTIQEGDEVVCIKGGKFGERFIGIIKGYGGIPKEVEVDWGKAVNPEDVEAVLAESSAKVLTLTHNETSTGVLNDAEAVGKVAREYGVLFVMDAVTSVGGDDVRTDEWGVDICITGSQKCLAAPPGMAMAALSERAWEAIEANNSKSYYLDLLKYRYSMRKETTPFTPSVPLVMGLKKALEEIMEEGIKERIKRHRTLAKASREAAKALNLALFPDEKDASNTVTAVRIPETLTDDDIRGRIKRDFGILLAGGQDEVKGKIFRIGHMGNVNQKDLLELLSALEISLEKSGYNIEAGKGVEAAKEVFLKK